MLFKAPLLGWMLLLAAPQSQAQPAKGSAAQVYAVTSDRYDSFRMPQVRLPDAAVARRINRQLLRQCVDYTGSADSTASPRQQLRQTLLECCYDQESKAWMAGGLGYTGTDYIVLLNRDFYCRSSLPGTIMALPSSPPNT